MYGEGLVHVVHGDVVPQRPQEVLRPRHRPAYLEFQNEAQRKNLTKIITYLLINRNNQTYGLKNQNDLELCKGERVEEDEDANVDFERSSPLRENSDGNILDGTSSLRHHFHQEGIGMNHP